MLFLVVGHAQVNPLYHSTAFLDTPRPLSYNLTPPPEVSVKPQIRRWFEESAETKLKFVSEHADRIQQLADRLVETFRKGNKVLLFGNGGRAMDALHIAADFVGRYGRERTTRAAVVRFADWV